MKKIAISVAAGLSLLSLPTFSAEVTTLSDYFDQDGIITTSENYPTLESARQFVKNQEVVGVNNFRHKRELTPLDEQDVVRMNRDTYYSLAVIDVSKGATISLPEIPKGKYMSIQGVTEDHRILPMQYGSGTFELSTTKGDHLYVIVRLDSTFTKNEAHAIQDKMVITAQSDKEFTAEQVNKASFEQTENALKAQMPAIFKREGASALVGMFTAPNDASKELFTKQKYAVGAAVGWGGAQMVDNIYEVSGNYPTDKCYQATFEDPQDQAFWSVTVYNKQGFMFNDVANISSNTAERNADGTYTVSFGCGSDALNNLETENKSNEFNLAFRHYIPSQKVKDGYRILPFVKEK
ncbi:TPA: DUF1214 domain-containing protein [Vibrio campbellii]|uniref:DUF1214 domain-containing protein n=1 Tax=Vibrio harveyi group TaxID=717610 RepID=UPI000693500D|nr:DUF1214 domain-containing protein [Vibrio campbellii]HDM8227595.1 DUF1214 domain-containing protein [Vibrio campbellii]